MRALEITNLRKTYSNGVEALKGIDFNVESGDFYALLGPNGAGKTTAIGIITSLVNKTAGKVRVFGHDLDTELEAAKACIGLVPQELNMNLFDSVENIVVHQAGYYGIGRHAAFERAEKYLTELRLWDRRKDAARSLSGGMKRRLMIARALIHEPRLLILDEPTAGVDIEIRRSMWDFLRQTNASGTTIILTTHYLEEAENLCRNIAIIDHGQIIEHNRMDRLLRKLHTEYVLLNLDQPLSQAPQLPGYPCRLVDEQTLEVEISQDRGLTRLFAELEQRGIAVQSMRNKANRLEELFVRLVESQGARRGAVTGAPA